MASADGVIVPFTTGLPVCASLCGPLFDVQGACSPPATAAVSDSCFCSDSRLKAFDDSGTAGVSSVCGTASCTSATDLQSIKTWYDTFCAANGSNTGTTTAGATATTTSAGSSTNTGSSGSSSSSSSSKSVGQTWLDGHWKWVVMLVVLFVVIVGGWILACMFRKRYLRRKEKQFEMRPPVAWGPHQMQGATGGINHSDAVINMSGAGAGGHHKEAAIQAVASPVEGQKGGKRLSKGWLGGKRG